MRWRRKKSTTAKRRVRELNLNFQRDVERCDEIDADETLTPGQKLRLKAIVMLGQTSHAHLIGEFGRDA